MAGHSKWNNIKQKKGKTDATRSKIFTKLGREISVAIKEGGASPENNSRLRDVIAKCRAANMPSDNVQRSIKKASGDGGGASFDEITYEGYGEGGVAVIVKSLTDNKNRSASDIRHIFDKYGNGMGVTGCVSWSFDNKGQILIDAEKYPNEEQVMMDALDSGAEDIGLDEGIYQILTQVADFSQLRENLEAKGYEFLGAEVGLLPQNMVTIDDTKLAEKITKLIDALEDNDDVQDVYHNADLPDEEE